MIYTTNYLKEKYKDYKNPVDKIKRECDKGNLIRVTQGVYETDKTINPHLLSEVILGPSYISFEYALSYYGLIPERVVAVTSATMGIRKNKRFVNNFGRFEYSDIPSNIFPLDLILLEENGRYYKIASMEKAICDSLYKWPVAHNIQDLKILLFEDKRIDEDAFKNCDFKKLLELASYYKKTNLNILIKLIRKEYYHE